MTNLPINVDIAISNNPITSEVYRIFFLNKVIKSSFCWYILSSGIYSSVFLLIYTLPKRFLLNLPGGCKYYRTFAKEFIFKNNRTSWGWIDGKKL